jgi:neurotransmitter-gated ion-channel
MPFFHHFTALLLVILAMVAPGASQAQDALPRPVMEAIESSPAPKPEEVLVGAYVNDIQQLDFKTNNYVIDLYVWFRWTSPDIDPSKSMEFMNRYASDDNRRDELIDTPEKMPDGSFYSIIRYQGLFATKFPLEAYPFDKQNLKVIMEDTLAGASEQVYVPDGEQPVIIDPVITLPGFTVGKPTMTMTTNTYPTNFGDLSVGKADPYSRIVISVPVTRPVIAMSLKTFVPILLIVVCASLVYFVRPRYVEGRIGLGITALLTLVALQLTATASLPDVDYLMMLDKVFLLAYLFIIVALARVVATSWRGADADSEAEIKQADRRWAAGVLALYLLLNVVVLWTALA